MWARPSFASQVTLKRSFGVTGLQGRLCQLRSPRLQAWPAPTLRAAWTPGPERGARSRSSASSSR